MLRVRVCLCLALLVTAATGLLALWTPFGVDQAIFVYGGKVLASGEGLYRDFWDIKPPGIFLFYAGAGALTGFSEPAIHALELAWQLALALLLMRIAGLLTHHRAATGLAPIAALSTYWVFGASSHHTQVEALVGLPITASLLLAFRLSRRPDSILDGVLLGLSAGVVAALKPLYLLFPVAFALLALATIRRERDERRRIGARRALSIVLWITMGLAVAWLPLILFFAGRGLLHEMLWTTFVYPREALHQVDAAPWGRLRDSALWCARIFAPYLPLMLFGMGSLRRARRATLAGGVILYLLVAGAMIFVQRTSWWEYHFVLLFPPLALLAALGLDTVLASVRLRQLPRALGAVVIGALLLLPALDLVAGVGERWSAITTARQTTSDAPLSARLDPEYLAIWEKTRHLREPGGYGTVYAFGDFRWVLLSGRRQAIAVHGHAWHHLPDRHWQRLPAELIAAQPRYLFVGGFYRKLLRHRAPELWHHIQTSYRPIGRHRSGRLYQRSR